MSDAFQYISGKALERWAELTSGKPWIRVGGGLSGQAVGADEIFAAAKEAINRHHPDANLSKVGSLGLMYREPVMDILSHKGVRVFYSNLTPHDVERIIEKFAESVEAPPNDAKMFAYESSDDEIEGLPKLQDIPEWKEQLKIVTRNFGQIDPRDILQYIANGGYSALDRAVTSNEPDAVLEAVKQSGLRGRGGAAFPTGLKWSFLAPSKALLKFVLCNCEEGDPGAFNDKSIIENDPHTLLEGLILNGYATRSHKGYVFIRHGHDIPIDNMRHAISQAYEHNLLGKNILGTDFSFDAEVALTGDSYVAGEETALMEAIEGKRSTPRFKPPFPAQAGLWQKPTNINNVKTLSYVPWIVLNGAEAFKRVGTEKSTGTTIICLSGHIKKPGLYEVPMGVTIRDLLEKIGGGPPDGQRIKLLQTGGPLGGVMGEKAFDTRIDFDEMAASGAILGSGGIIVCNETVNVVDLIRNLIAFNQFESCGKCFPCRLGNTHMLEIMDRICKNSAAESDLEVVKKVGRDMKVGSLCGHGQLGFNPVSSALEYFGEEFANQLMGKLEPAGAFEDGSMILPTRTRP